MNELKRELMKVAGDVSDSERRVKEAVHRRQHKRKRTWMPVLAVITLVALGLFFAQLKTNETSATLSYDEYAYYVHVEPVMLNQDVQAYDKTRAFQRLLERIGRVEYGKSLGLSVSDEEIKASLEKNKEITESVDYEQMIEKVLNEANVSKKAYTQIVREQTESRLMGELISQQLMEHYEQLNDTIASQMVNKYAVDYMTQHHAEMIDAFRTDYQIQPETSSPGIVLGVVGLVEGNMFYLVQDVTLSDSFAMTRDEILTTYFENERGAWYPNVDALDVQVGDVVRVLSGSSSGNLEEKHRVAMNHGDAEIVQRASAPKQTIRLTGTDADKFTAHIETLDWENSHVSMIRLPDYIVIVNGRTYSIWSKYNNSGMEMVQHYPNAYVKLTKSKAAPLYELLQ
ncbi:MAG: hypothetical protein ABS949_06235 [Solibacillus sp.]